MTGREQLRERNHLAAAAPMAARAVALCEGCPMAKFCADKTVTPCETPQAQDAHIDMGGGGRSFEIEMPVRTSYREELFDSSKNLVMAELQKIQKPKEKLRPAVSTKLSSSPSRIQVPKPQPNAQNNRRQLRTLVSAKNRSTTPKQELGEGSSDIVAGILAAIVGVSGIATVSAKKSV